MAIRLHVEDERAIPLSVSGGNDVEMKHSEAFINAISPTARVEQTEGGAVVTITDKNGTTTAEINNGQPGSDADVTAENIEEALGYVPADERIKSAMFFGQCDPTSTSTKFTAQIDGITEYFDGLTILLKNGVVESKTGCTFNINGLGEKGAWGSYELSRISTAFTLTRVYVFIYDSSLDEGNGGFWVYQGKDSNDNTLAYIIRTNQSALPVSSYTGRYRLLFTSADKTHYVPATNSTSTNTTAKREVCQEKIDPFGKIVYYAYSTELEAESRTSHLHQFTQYTFALGYSFNRTGIALTLTPWKPVYIKATPYEDGSAIIDADEPFTQDLPIAEDGKIYIHLAIAYTATAVEMSPHHPIYYYRGGSVQLWTGPIHAELEQLYNAFPVDSASGDVASFTDGADNLPLKSLTVDIDPVQSGEGDPSPTNVRPISGWTGAEVTHCGTNAWDEEWETGGLVNGAPTTDASRIRSKNYSACVPNRTYYKHSNSGDVINIFWYDAAKTFIRYNTASGGNVVTAPQNAYFFKFCTTVAYGGTYKGDISINYPSSDHDYHPYTGQTLPINWQTEAGTVYGGSLDVLTGVLTVEYVKDTYTWGSLNVRATDNGYTRKLAQLSHSSASPYSTKQLCNVGVKINDNATLSPHFYCIDASGIVMLPDETPNDTEIQLLYKLAEPLTYQLTPHEVRSLLGSNTIYADTGDTSVEYRADIQRYIDKRLSQ